MYFSFYNSRNLSHNIQNFKIKEILKDKASETDIKCCWNWVKKLGSDPGITFCTTVVQLHMNMIRVVSNSNSWKVRGPKQIVSEWDLLSVENERQSLNPSRNRNIFNQP